MENSPHNETYATSMVPLRAPGESPRMTGDDPYDEPVITNRPIDEVDDDAELEARLEQARRINERDRMQNEIRSLEESSAILRRTQRADETPTAPLRYTDDPLTSLMDSTPSKSIDGSTRGAEYRSLGLKLAKPTPFNGKSIDEYLSFIDALNIRLG